MEIRRVANNEGFIKNIILSIDDNMNNFNRNYARFDY